MSGWKTLDHQAASKIIPMKDHPVCKKIPRIWLLFFIVKNDGAEYSSWSEKIDWELFQKLFREWRKNPPDQKILEEFKKTLNFSERDHEMNLANFSNSWLSDLFYDDQKLFLDIVENLNHFGYNKFPVLDEWETNFLVQGRKNELLGCDYIFSYMESVRTVGEYKCSYPDGWVRDLVISEGFSKLIELMRNWRRRNLKSVVRKEFKEILNLSMCGWGGRDDYNHRLKTIFEFYMEEITKRNLFHTQERLDLLIYFGKFELRNNNFLSFCRDITTAEKRIDQERENTILFLLSSQLPSELKNHVINFMGCPLHLVD
jgi:hypothetical protein